MGTKSVGHGVSTSINCTMSYTIAPPQQKHAEVAEELQKTQAELQQLKASLADIEQETTAAERKKAVIFASFCEKSIATMLASVTSDMLYYILSSIVFGSGQLDGWDETYCRIGVLGLASVLGATGSVTADRVMKCTHADKWTYLFAFTTLWGMFTPMVIAWAGKDFITAITTQLSLSTGWEHDQFVVNTFIAVSFTFLLAVCQILPCYTKAKAKQAAGLTRATVCRRLCLTPDHMALGLGFAWNLVTTYWMGEIEPSADGSSYKYMLQLIVQSIYFLVCLHFCVEISAWIKSGQAKEADSAQARALNRATAIATLKRLDINSDGVVKRDEFLAAGGTNADFDRIDLNADGGLDENELEVAARDLKRAVGNLQLKVMGFLVGWGLNDTLNDAVFGVFCECSGGPTSCSFGSNFGFAIGVTVIFSYFVIYLQDQAAGKGKLENTLRTKNLAGLDTRQEAELLSQTHLALLSNALSLIVGWAWKTFFAVFIDDIVTNETSGSPTDYLKGYIILFFLLFIPATLLIRRLLASKIPLEQLYAPHVPMKCCCGAEAEPTVTAEANPTVEQTKQEAKGTEAEAGVKMDLKSEPTSVTPQHSEPSSEPLSIAEQAQLELEQNSWNDVESKDKTSPVVGLSAVMNQL